jgi:hypothetical protein
MWTTNFIEAVSERDVDLLLLEEFKVNPPFRSWFIHQTINRLSSANFVGAFHSISDARLGESDIVLGFDAAAGRCAVLLENKIDATFQPAQAERYHRRGQEGVKQGLWVEFITCIVAPDVFLKNQSGVDEFDVCISYEQLIHWFAQREPDDGDRSKYKAEVLRYALEKTRRRGLGKSVPEVTAFWAGYWQLASREFPELRMRQPGGKGPLADWPDFRGNGLPAGTHIIHKWADGKVDLELSGMQPFEDDVRQRVTPLLPDDASIEVTGRSLAVRLMVPPLDRWALFDTQVGAARSGLTAVKRLLQLAPQLFSNTAVLNLRKNTGPQV